MTTKFPNVGLQANTVKSARTCRFFDAVPASIVLRSTRQFDLLGATSRAVSVFSALLYSTVDTRSCVSLRRLSRISHMFHITLFHVRLVSGSHLSVAQCSHGKSGLCVPREATKRVIVAVVMVTRPAVWQRRASCLRSTSLFPQRATSTSSLWTI